VNQANIWPACLTTAIFGAESFLALCPRYDKEYLGLLAYKNVFAREARSLISSAMPGLTWSTVCVHGGAFDKTGLPYLPLTGTASSGRE
jgi:hypothetical protein